MRQPLSLKGRAIALLAQREQSVLELRRKLLRHARAQAAATAASCAEDADRSDPAELSGRIEAEVESVIDWLREHDYLNEARFVESRVQARSARFGSLRIQRELAQHGLSMTRDEATALRASDADRAAELWQRKFGHASVDPAQQGRQMRFLVARGFAPEVVRRLVRPNAASRTESQVDDAAPDEPEVTARFGSTRSRSA